MALKLNEPGLWQDPARTTAVVKCAQREQPGEATMTALSALAPALGPPRSELTPYADAARRARLLVREAREVGGASAYALNRLAAHLARRSLDLAGAGGAHG